MKIFPRLALGATLLLVVAACADPSGQPWTPPPAGSVAPATEAPASVAPASVAPSAAASAAPSAAASAAASVAPSAAPSAAAPSAAASVPAASVTPGEARVIELELTSALEIKQNGEKVTDIPVTPGETVTFKITNSAGFAHNFWIGTDQQLLLNQTEGLTGIPEFSEGTQELTWTVPADVTGLKFGCTVPGHYTLMQGTFSAAGPAASVPAGTTAPAASAAPSVAPSAAASVPASSQEPTGRVVELVLTAALQITDASGVQIKDIPVTPGETIVFKLTNTAGYAHNFWIGPDQALQTNQTDGLTGEPDWSDAEPKELTWVVPADITGLHFGCTVPGHYTMMNGTFSAAS